MSSLDLVTLLAVAVSTVAVLFRQRPLTGRERYIAWAALALGITHVLFARRQSFYPVYGVAVALAFTMRPATYGSRTLRKTMGAAGLLALLAAGVLTWAFPLFRLPDPTGPYRIGSRWLVITDSSRAEDLTTAPDDRRELLVRLWYPADTAIGLPMPMLPLGQAQALAKYLSLPAFAFNHLARIPTHAFARSTLSARQERWPVAVFSHGYGQGYESQNTVQMEELASQGYVVVSIGHPYEAGALLFPDGRLITMRALPAMDSLASAGLATMVGKVATEQDTVALKPVIAAMHAALPLHTSIERWTADTRFVLDQFTRWNTTGTPLGDLGGHLQLDQVAILGMSFGGATAANTCTVDPRCAVGINLDGLAFGEATRQPIPRPFLHVSSNASRYIHEIWFQRSTAPAWHLAVNGALHLDFTDLGFVSPLFARLGILGGIPAPRIHGIMNAALRGVIGQHLRGGPPLDSAALAPWPEATLRARPGTAPAAPPPPEAPPA